MIRNRTRNTTIATTVEIANDPGASMKGLLGRREFPQGEALIIRHCQSIHMFFMKFPIDAIFCNDQDKVVGLCKDIKPFHLSPIFFKALYVIELPTGTITTSNTQIGDQVEI
jgi:uncharacterized membrane protein (UPF0127 family)